MYNIRYLHYNRNELIYFYEHEDDITNGAAIIWFRMLYNDLYNCIIERGGAIVSEFPPGATVHPGLFVARNRIISGLARGIDAAAHRGSLASGTVAVIGGGIDNVYPAENEILYNEIAEAGAIISELPFGAKPHARSFPSRNRIIAGMSRATAVIEASLKSGSLITAHFANDYGRDVFAVPGSPMDPRCHGTNQLIRDGATMLETARDILNNLSPMEALPLADNEPSMFSESGLNPDSDLLQEARAAITAALSPTPTLLDDLLAASGVSPHLTMAVLLELELAGRLQRHPGAKVSLLVGVDQNYG